MPIQSSILSYHRWPYSKAEKLILIPIRSVLVLSFGLSVYIYPSKGYNIM
jgi:hypothetical protein